MPDGIRLIDAEMAVPANCHAPVTAALAMETARGAAVTADFDFLQTGPQTWDIAIETAGGTLVLGQGGNTLTFEGETIAVEEEGEYPAMYREFVELVANGRSLVDIAPLQLVADAFLRARITTAPPFEA